MWRKERGLAKSAISVVKKNISCLQYGVWPNPRARQDLDLTCRKTVFHTLVRLRVVESMQVWDNKGTMSLKGRG